MATPITVIIGSNQTTDRERLRKQLAGHHDIQVVGEAQSDQECLDIALRQRPRVLMIQEDIPTQGGLLLAQQVAERAPDIGVILMLTNPAGEEMWHKMLRAGVRDFITRNTPNDLIIEEIRRLAASRKPASSTPSGDSDSPKNRIITVAAPRGGTGKTMIATNLAVALAMRKENVALLDLNLVGGDVAVLLDLMPRRTVADLMTSYAAIDEDVMESLLMKHRSGLQVLPAPLGGNFDGNGMSRPMVQSVLQFMRDRCACTIVDTGHPSFEGTLAAMDSSDIIMVVVGHDLPRLRDGKEYLQNLMAANYAKSRIRVVVNRSGIGKAISNKEAESILEFPVLAYLSNDTELVGESINMGQPFMISAPQKPLSRELGELVDKFATKTESAPKKTRSLFGIAVN